MLQSSTMILTILTLHLFLTNVNTEDLRCQPDIPCAFPFVFLQELHYECTNVTDPSYRLWCSTKTSTNSREHLIGNWKHCNSECGTKKNKTSPISTQISGQLSPANENRTEKTKLSKFYHKTDVMPAMTSSGRPKRSLMGILDGGIPTPSKDCFTTTGSNDPNKACIFPFKYGGKIFYACTWVMFHIIGGPWCSTKVDKEGNYIKGHFGVCTPDKCPIPQRECGKPTIERSLEIGLHDVTIQKVPWMASLGIMENEQWVHQCGGSLITNYHILTAAHCFNVVEQTKYPYKARLGNENLEQGEAEIRDIVKVLRHPKYRSGRAYFNVGLAIMGKKIEFNDYILPVCLPYFPVDDTDDLADTFVLLAGWGNDNYGNRATTLSVENLQILSLSQCSNVFSAESVSKFGLQSIKLRQQLPNGITPDVMCVGSPILVAGSCEGDSGSPIILPRSDATGDRYYTAVALVSGGPSCALEAQIYTRLANRQILTWIQRNSDTSPYLMVIGGYNGHALRDVELVSAEPRNLCATRVRPLNGRLSLNHNGSANYEDGTLGLTGQLTEDGVIVCGGENGDRSFNTCQKYQPLSNEWMESPIPGDLPDMLEPRSYAGSTLDEHGNMWIIGGHKGGKSATTEVFNFQQKRWQRHRSLPSYYHNSGLSSHCVISLNKTHVVIIGGHIQFTQGGDRSENNFGIIEAQDKAWMFDGYEWNELNPMLTRRDGLACSLVQNSQGKLLILAAGGCDKWCTDNPAMSSAEILDLETGKWSPVADLPIPLMNAQMAIFDGYPTIVGGYDNRQRNGKLFQYIIEEDRWVEHPIAKLRIPRSSPAVIQVPKNMFDDC